MQISRISHFIRPFHNLFRPAWLWLFSLVLTWPLMAQSYSPPSPRVDVNLDATWRFIRQDVSGAQNVSFDDSGWANLNLPHTWNNLDGQDGGNNYYRGVGWYRRHISPGAEFSGKRLFLKFDGANLVADVYVNGSFAGEHRGGYASFVFDVTPYLAIGADNVIAVKVNNAYNSDVAPLAGDFTMCGGIYRDVHLLATDPVQVSPLDYGSPGVYLKPTNVSSNSANLQITAVVSNANPVPANITMRTIITDAATNIVTTLTNVVSMSAASLSNVVANTVIANPHLWNGLADPYLYQAFVEIYSDTNLTDLVNQPLGFRYFSLDPTNGFFLNGRAYDLHGVNMHQDWINQGWALNDAQRETNFMFLKELGVTAYRMAHYQKDDYEYQLADRNGILLWSEIPLVNTTTEGTAFYDNAKQQLRELIRQNYNHPSVICWGMYNELTLGLSTSLVSQLVQLEAQEDPTRPSTAAVLHSSNGDANAWTPQVVAFNMYYGWYFSPLNGLASWADTIHAAHPTNCIGISEFGAGASIYQHGEDPVAWPSTGGAYHPEEWQNIVHESNWAAMKARPFIWCKFVWAMFDSASDGRNEGDTSGRNDKGLATYDRLTRKDAFYFYKANWTTNPMVYITGHTFTNRLTNSITTKVYANCDSVELLVNGVSQGSQTGTNCVFAWPVALAGGSNYVQAIGTKGGNNVTDSLVWFAPMLPPVLSVASPVGGIASLTSTNDTLWISVNVSNPMPANPLTTAWSQSAGPGVATFANSNAPATSVRFSADGIYRLTCTASNGAIANINLAVLVNTDARITNGLAAWWKMDETSGSTASDSSGNGRNATVVSGAFASGYLSNALQLTASTSRASYAAQQSNQVTVAAWVRCDTAGGSGFPRILDTPGYRFFFRCSSSFPDLNSVGFGTYDSVNGDFDSGGGTISLGTWHHVAATFDRSSLATPPTFYVNGKKMTTTTLTQPSGTAPSLSGTGYIGNNSANTRNWNGLIDDLRVYNRLLSDSEVQILAAASPDNLAPEVSTGADQRIIWPATVTLTVSVTDDGQPMPPGAVTVNWSQFSGPGSVTFGNTNALSTGASFSAPGLYVLQLAANDGQAVALSFTSVNVVARPMIAYEQLPGGLRLSWSASGLAWRLQSQTNSLAAGLDTNWNDVPGSTATNQMYFNFQSFTGAMFFRLVGE